jgi:hypothetical protein
MTTASRVSDSREAFEAWVTEQSSKELWPKNPLERRSDLNYSAIATHYAWKAWKAALACQGEVVKVSDLEALREEIRAQASLKDHYAEWEETERMFAALIAKANGHE